ncbi:MAG: hypothetical protein ACQEWI_16985 [Bacillota bacterium]
MNPKEIVVEVLEIKRWIYVLAVREQVGERSILENEVITLSLTRAKKCELLAEKHNRGSMKSSYFLTGLFSLMETILSMPIEVILNELPLNDEIYNALTGASNEFKDILELVILLEKADWAAIEIKMAELKLNKGDVMECY